MVCNGAPKWIRTTGLCLRRATLYPAELWVHVAGAKRRLAKPIRPRQHQIATGAFYFGALTIGWNMPRPQLAPGFRLGVLYSTVMMSTEQSCDRLVL